MKLVIAEKPSLGRAIADALPGTPNGRDPITKGDYVVTWAYGHILSLKEPEDYDPGYKKWRLEALPIFFENWEQKPSPGKEDKLGMIGELLKNAECVIHAGDPDDEGQYLIDEILRRFQYAGPVYRLDTANTTKEALQKSLRHMQDNKRRARRFPLKSYTRPRRIPILRANSSWCFQTGRIRRTSSLCLIRRSRWNSAPSAPAPAAARR